MFVWLTNDDDMCANNLGLAEAIFNGRKKPIILTDQNIVEYLNADPCHAVVVQPYASGELYTIWRGTGLEARHFYYQRLPFEELEASGGNLTAEEVLQAVMK